MSSFNHLNGYGRIGGHQHYHRVLADMHGYHIVAACLFHQRSHLIRKQEKIYTSKAELPLLQHMQSLTAQFAAHVNLRSTRDQVDAISVSAVGQLDHAYLLRLLNEPFLKVERGLQCRNTSNCITIRHLLYAVIWPVQTCLQSFHKKLAPND